MTVGKMTIERFTAILDAYGADPLHWPEGERLVAQAFAAREPRAGAMLAEAEAFDLVLDEAPGLAPSRELTSAVLAARPGRSWIARLWTGVFPDMPVWRPALGLVTALALGFGIQTAAADRLLDDEGDVAVADDSGEILAPLSGSDMIADEDSL